MERRQLLRLALAAAIAVPMPVLAAEEKKTADAPSTYFVDIGGLNATIRRPNGMRGVLTINSVIDAGNTEGTKKVNLLLPRIRSELVLWLQGYGLTLPRGQLPDLELIRSGFQQVVDRFMGRGKARVLILGLMTNT